MFEIKEKIECDAQNCKILKFIIKYNEQRPNGDSCIFLQFISTLNQPISGIKSPQINRWKKLGLKKDHLFACLDDFYPHGRSFTGREKYFRKGIGKNVLNQLISMIMKYEPKIIYAIPTNEEIKYFLLAQGWQSDYKNNKLMYKLL
jgi:hypothetical protein